MGARHRPEGLNVFSTWLPQSDSKGLYVRAFLGERIHLYSAREGGKDRNVKILTLQGSVAGEIRKLSELMVCGAPVTLHFLEGNGVVQHTGLLNRIEREDGSGRCYNLTIATPHGEKTLFARFSPLTPIWSGRD